MSDFIHTSPYNQNGKKVEEIARIRAPIIITIALSTKYGTIEHVRAFTYLSFDPIFPKYFHNLLKPISSLYDNFH